MTVVLQTLPLGETGQRAGLFLLLSYPDICILSKAALPPDTSRLLTELPIHYQPNSLLFLLK